jgi:hypothetical protein
LIARGGRDAITPQVLGTYKEDFEYHRLDIVALNGSSFIAKRDDPGPCPGEGWQLLASAGRTGGRGEKGAQAPRLFYCGEKDIGYPALWGFSRSARTASVVHWRQFRQATFPPTSDCAPDWPIRTYQKKFFGLRTCLLCCHAWSHSSRWFFLNHIRTRADIHDGPEFTDECVVARQVASRPVEAGNKASGPICPRSEHRALQQRPLRRIAARRPNYCRLGDGKLGFCP